MHIGWFEGSVISVSVLAALVYVRAWKWLDIPADSWSPRLETDTYPYLAFPRPLQVLYEHNLAWRRNVALRREAKRTRTEYIKPYSAKEVEQLEKVLGRPLDPDMKRSLSDRSI